MCPGGGMVDAADLKSASLKGVGVRVPSWAFHNKASNFIILITFLETLNEIALKMNIETQKYGWIVISLWLIATMFGFIMIFTIGLFLPSIAKEMNLSPGMQGILGSSAFLGQAIVAIPMAWWTSRFNPIAVITSTIALGALFLVLQGWSPSFAILLIGRFAFGIALVTMEPPGAKLIYQWFPVNKILFVNAIQNALFGFLMAIGVLVTPILLDIFNDWRLLLYLSGAVYGLIAIVWVLVGRQNKSSLDQQKADEKKSTFSTTTPIMKVLSHRSLVLTCIGFAAAAVVFSSFNTFFPTLAGSKGISLGWSGILLAINFVTGGILGLIMSRFFGKLSYANLIMIILIIVMIVSYTLITLTDNRAILIILVIFTGISGAYFPILYTEAFKLTGVTVNRIPIAIATVMAAFGLGLLIGPLITGFIQETTGNLELAMIISAQFGFLLLPAAIFLKFTSDHTEVETRVTR